MITREATRAALAAAAAGASTRDALRIAAEADPSLRAVAAETSELDRTRLEALGFDPPLTGTILAMPFGVLRMRAADLLASALATKPPKRGILGGIALLIATSVLFQVLVVMKSSAFIAAELGNRGVAIAFVLILVAHALALAALALRLGRPRIRTLVLAGIVPWLMPMTLRTAAERNRRRGISRAGVLRCLAAGDLAGLSAAETAERLIPSFGGPASGLGLELLTRAHGHTLADTLSQWTGPRSALRALGFTPLVGESSADALVRLARVEALTAEGRAAQLLSWAAASCAVVAVFAATNGVFGSILGIVGSIPR